MILTNSPNFPDLCFIWIAKVNDSVIYPKKNDQTDPEDLVNYYELAKNSSAMDDGFRKKVCMDLGIIDHKGKVLLNVSFVDHARRQLSLVGGFDRSLLEY